MVLLYLPLSFKVSLPHSVILTHVSWNGRRRQDKKIVLCSAYPSCCCLSKPLQHPGDISISIGAATGDRKSRRERLAELLDFANETFLHDQDLAQQHALNITIEGLYSEQYWVS